MKVTFCLQAGGPVLGGVAFPLRSSRLREAYSHGPVFQGPVMHVKALYVIVEPYIFAMFEPLII